MVAGSSATPDSEPRKPPISLEGVRHAGANVGLAAIFFAAAVPVRLGHLTTPADLIWNVGMALMGLFCLVRPKPAAVLLDWRAMLSGAGSMVLPALMLRAAPQWVADPHGLLSSLAPLAAMFRIRTASTGLAHHAAVILELLGVTICQVARVYMGRAFGVLPANRGIVSSGPFRFVRHPVYLGWLLLAAGFAAVYQSPWNVAAWLACLSLTIWRINLEEELLGADPEYRAYLSRVRYRMLPGLY